MYHLQFNETSVIDLHTVNRSDSSIYYDQFGMSHIFVHRLNVKEFYLIYL